MTPTYYALLATWICIAGWLGLREARAERRRRERAAPVYVQPLPAAVAIPTAYRRRKPFNQ